MGTQKLANGAMKTGKERGVGGHGLPAFALVMMLLAWQMIVFALYFSLHNIDLATAFRDHKPIPALQFVSEDKILGIAVEIVAWSGLMVIVRRIGRINRSVKHGQFDFWRETLDFVADYLESIVLTFVLMALLRVPKVTLDAGINISLNDATIHVIIALALIFGWSVSGTRSMLTRVFDGIRGNRNNRNDRS